MLPQRVKFLNPRELSFSTPSTPVPGCLTLSLSLTIKINKPLSVSQLDLRQACF
jgi:hypothetical protein